MSVIEEPKQMSVIGVRDEEKGERGCLMRRRMKGVDIYTSVQTNMQCRRPKQMPVIGMKEEEKSERG